MPGYDVSPTDRKFGDLINRHRDKLKDVRATWNLAADLYRGDTGEGGLNLDLNNLYPFADTMTANISPPNPQVTVKAHRQMNDDSARYREALTNELFRLDKLHQKLWKAVTRASIFPRSHLKVVWSEKHKRPTFRVLNPHQIFFDANAEEYEDARYIIEVYAITRSEFRANVESGDYEFDQELYHAQFNAYPKWLEEKSHIGTNPDDAGEVAKASAKWITVYEVHDLVAKDPEEEFRIYVEDIPFAVMSVRRPYKHVENPFYLLTFNDNLKDLGGLSDASLVLPSVQRLNELSGLEMWAGKTSIPVMVIDETKVDDAEEVEDGLARVDGPGRILRIKLRNGVNLNDVMGVIPLANSPGEWGRSMECAKDNLGAILALPGYARGSLGQTELATEVALSDSAIKTRNSRRQQAVYDMVAWAAEVAIALYAEKMDPDTEIPVRLGVGGGEETNMDRNVLAFDGDTLEETFAYDYTTLPYNAQEANDVVQLKMLSEFLPILLQGAEAGEISMERLMGRLTKSLKMDDLLTTPEEKKKNQEQMEAQQPPPGMPMPGGEGGGGGLDGAMPGIPSTAQSPMNGGEVQVGSGAVKVPGGLEGGNQPGFGGGA